jgi:hypothetical protein
MVWLWCGSCGIMPCCHNICTVWGALPAISCMSAVHPNIRTVHGVGQVVAAANHCLFFCVARVCVPRVVQIPTGSPHTVTDLYPSRLLTAGTCCCTVLHMQGRATAGPSVGDAYKNPGCFGLSWLGCHSLVQQQSPAAACPVVLDSLVVVTTGMADT